MKMQEDSFISSEGTKKVKYFVFTPQTEPVGVIQICHGMCEYVFRYREFCEFMTENGWAVIGNDHLGHGYTALENGNEQGFFSDHNGWRFLVKDVRKTTEIARERFPEKPIILLGHSMGSFVARSYVSWYGEGLTAAIFMGTSSGLPAGITEAATRLAATIRGDRAQLDKLQFALYGVMNRGISDRKTDLDWITRDEAKIVEYQNDKLGTFAFTAKAFNDMVKLLNSVNNTDWAYSVPKTLPILLISGEQDALGDYGKGIKKVYNRLKRAGVDYVSVKIYKDARHELINEINREEVYNDLLKWVQRRLKG